MPAVYYAVLAAILTALIGVGVHRCTIPPRCHTNSIGQWCDYEGGTP